MKTNIMLVLTTAVFSITAHAAQDPVPDIIFVPENAKVIEAEQKRRGGFELEADVSGSSLVELSEEAKAFYTRMGFELRRDRSDADDVELVFVKEQESIEIDIELEHNEIIEFSVDYETR
ncbi:hypothetical protein [Oceanisphaera sp. KMM 10153]|uniref:hypothetical protein n=1 Tax=Oceanisphaera submarina TaxID=3390193 RepID=UPI0039762880